MFVRRQGCLEEGASPHRLDDDIARAPLWAEGLGAELDGLLAAFRRMRDDVETIADRMRQAEPTERRNQLLGELRGVVRRLEAASDGLNRTLRPVPGGPPTVRWVERAGQKGMHVALAAVPLDLAPVLRELLFGRGSTVAPTSAPLAAGGEFDFLESRVGLGIDPNPVTVREILPSPFDYPSQCLFGIPNDLPDPREDEPGHDASVARAVTELAWASDGGMFALFTSHAALRRAAAALRASLPPLWPLQVLVGGRRDLLLRPLREAGN